MVTADIAQPLAIDGGPPVRATPWPVDPDPGFAADPEPAEALAQALAVLLSVDAADIRVYGHFEAAAAVALGTVGADRDGGELLVPALATPVWLAVAGAAGLRPVPLEVDAETGAVAPRTLSQALQASPAARAVVVTHPFGHPAALTELERVAQGASVPLIEDAAAALGASERGRPAGTVGTTGLFRLGSPDVPDAAFAVRSAHGDAEGSALASLPDEVARRALAWLRAEPDALARRRRLAWELTFGIRGMRGVAGMHHGRYVRVAYGSYIARLRRIVWKRPLEDTLAALRAEGIPCEAAFGDPPLHAHPDVERALGRDDGRLAADGFPVAGRLPTEWIAIPLPAHGTQREVDDAVAALRKLEAAGV